MAFVSHSVPSLTLAIRRNLLRCHCSRPLTTCKIPSLFTTTTGEVFELTPEELSTGFMHTMVTADENNEGPSKTSVTELKLPLRPKYAGPNPLDGSADASTTPPAQISTPQSPRSLSCGSASPLIEILTPAELLRKNSLDSPQSPTSAG